MIDEGFKSIPKKLVGDKVRLEQILVTLIKYCLRLTFGKDLLIIPNYESEIETLSIKVVAGETVEERFRESENHEFESVNRDTLNLRRERQDFTNSLGLFICQKILSSSGGSI